MGLAFIDQSRAGGMLVPPALLFPYQNTKTCHERQVESRLDSTMPGQAPRPT